MRRKRKEEEEEEEGGRRTRLDCSKAAELSPIAKTQLVRAILNSGTSEREAFIDSGHWSENGPPPPPPKKLGHEIVWTNKLYNNCHGVALAYHVNRSVIPQVPPLNTPFHRTTPTMTCLGRCDSFKGALQRQLLTSSLYELWVETCLHNDSASGALPLFSVISYEDVEFRRLLLYEDKERHESVVLRRVTKKECPVGQDRVDALEDKHPATVDET